MTREELELLGSVKIASPCPMNWNDLQGDDKKRHCSQCNLHVYKVSAMTTAEAVALFQKVRSERVCAQLFHRMDGTVMTKDCPSAWAVGLSEAVRRIGRPTGIVAGALVFVLAVFLTFVTFFGDNIRSLFGMSAGGLAGSTVVTPRALRTGVVAVDYKNSPY